MQENDQTCLNNPAIFILQDFKSMFDHFSTSQKKGLNYNFKSINLLLKIMNFVELLFNLCSCLGNHCSHMVLFAQLKKAASEHSKE